jgi:hypothetical protein
MIEGDDFGMRVGKVCSNYCSSCLTLISILNTALDSLEIMSEYYDRYPGAESLEAAPSFLPETKKSKN